MKNNSKYIWTGFIFGVVLIFIFVGNISNAQNLENYVVAGERLDGIIIGKSTADSVIANYGEDYKLINYSGYSYQMIYKKLGLGFYYCQNDPNKEIFSVEIKSPAKAVTSKGIRLGKSTFKDVFRLYGEREEESVGFEYVGISFNYKEENTEEDLEDIGNPDKASQKEVTEKKRNLLKKVVKRIDLFEMSELRQCDVNFPKN
ncbi:MAG: hypothetical protein ACR2J3_13500 [Aridibacter sp.]